MHNTDALAYKIKPMHASEVMPGYTILWRGETYTVGKNDIKQSSFFGYTYRGENLYKSNNFVDVVLFKRFYKGEFYGWVH